MLTDEALSQIASEHVRRDYPEGYVSQRVATLVDPAGAYFFGVWGGPPDPPGSPGHLLFGPGGFFVSAMTGSVTVYGALEFMEAREPGTNEADETVATIRALLAKQPPN